MAKKKKAGVASRARKKTLSSITTRNTQATPRKKRQPAALTVTCPSCGAAPMQACLLLTGPMGHRRTLEAALKFNAYAAHVPEPHAARTAALLANAGRRSPHPR